MIIWFTIVKGKTNFKCIKAVISILFAAFPPTWGACRFSFPSHKIMNGGRAWQSWVLGEILIEKNPSPKIQNSPLLGRIPHRLKPLVLKASQNRNGLSDGSNRRTEIILITNWSLQIYKKNKTLAIIETKIYEETECFINQLIYESFPISRTLPLFNQPKWVYQQFGELFY